MIEKLAARIQQLSQEIEQSVARHNSMIGALQELKTLYHEAVAAAPIAKEVVDIVAPAEAPAIDAAIDAVL